MADPQDHASWSDPQKYSGIDQEFIRRWKEALEKSKGKLADEDRKVVESLKTPEAILLDLEDMQRRQNHGWLRQMGTQLSPFMKSFQAFSTCFVIAMLPHSVETSLAWGVFSLVLRLGYMSEQRAQKIVEVLNSLRRVLLKVNRFAGGQLAQEEEVKEALVNIYVKLVEFWVKLVKELRSDPSGLKNSIWKDITGSLNQTLVEIKTSYDAMRELADYHQSFRMDKLGQTLPESTVVFPVFLLPIPENPHFFGREDTLKRMHDHLDPATRGRKLRCFTVYGLGGIGKTQVAVAYAYEYGQGNDSRSYDAVFWIASEDKAAMRRSFSNIALGLKLPGISESSTPQTISDTVRNWLKQTDKSWLLIYDNAERWNDIMPDYWPLSGSAGSVIITSRDFTLARSPASNDEELQVLSRDDSWNFVSSLLKDWDSDSKDEREALEELLVQLDGLPLALHQISGLITAGRSSVQDFLEMYKEQCG